MAPKKRRVDEEEQEDLRTDPETKPQEISDGEDKREDGGDEEEEGEEEEEEEDVGELLEPLSRDQLASLLRSAAAAHPPTLAEIRRVADLDPAHRKLFVHGLGWDTTSDGLRAAFAPFGDVEDCRVVLDRHSGRSKGYGFVLFRRRSSSRRALRFPHKTIDGRLTACQLASLGPPPQNPNPAPNANPNPNPSPGPGESNLPRKIYVGNVHADIDGGRLRNFFAKYGEIDEGPIGFDRQTGRPKGFALFVYKTVEGARRALEEPNKNFEGHQLYCQKATDNKTKAAASTASGPPVTAAPMSNLPQDQGYNVSSGYAGPALDMGLPAMMGQGLLGMAGAQPFGQGVQPNAALLAMLAAAGQNPAAFGISPAMLASLNPSLAAAFSGGAQAVVPPAGMPSTAPVQGYAMGNAGFQQNAGFQAPPGFQVPPGFQGAPPVAQQGGGGGTYQGGPMGQSPMPRPPVGPMSGGYGPH